MKIDAHMHLPAMTEGRTFEQAQQLLLSDLERDEIDYAILIPDNIAGSPIGDVETCLPFVDSQPRLFTLGTIDVEREGQEWLAYLETLINHRKIVGLKIFPGHDPIYPTDPRLSPLYALGQTYRVPVVIHTGWNSNDPDAAKYNDPKYIVEIATTYPKLPLVIAHFFWPQVEYCHRMTVSYPSIYYDTSGLADKEVLEVTGPETMQRVLLKTLEHDPSKVIFGTDYAMCDRQDHIQWIDALPVAQAVREDIFWRNARRLFSLPVNPSGERVGQVHRFNLAPPFW